MNRYSIVIALGLLAGCSTAPSPPLKADDPASPSAPEAPVRATHNALATDGLTKKSRQILAQAAEERQSVQSEPDIGDQKGQEMKDMPNMQPPSPTSQEQKMRGMQIPQGPSQPSLSP
jgi:hypothetical protein